MTKVFLMSILTTGIIFAFNAEVKKADVSLLVNDLNKTYKVGDKFTLSIGDIICFVKGEGRVVIEGKNYKKQLTKRSKSCKHLPGNDKKPTTYAKSLQGSIISLFTKAKEQSINSVSIKKIESDILTAPVSISQDAKYLLVENSTWGPLPVKLEIIDKNGTVKESMVNKEDILTSFILPIGMLKEGYSIRVTNALEGLHVNSTVHFQATIK